MQFGLVAVIFALCLGVFAVPPELRAFEADVRIETSMMPFPYDSHCYWDADLGKYRVDSKIMGMMNYDISDFNNSVRYIIDDTFGQVTCRRCLLDEDMMPMQVPPLCHQEGTDTVNGEVCDVWKLRAPMLDWSFCTQQHAPYAVLRSSMVMSNPAMTVKTTMTFSNILAYHPPPAVFEPNSTECEPPKCAAPVDVVLLIDGSGSISDSDFSLMKKFGRLLIDNFTLSEKAANFAVVQFSIYARTETGLSGDANTVRSAIDNMMQMKQSTNMDAGLDKSLDILKGSTRGTNQVCIMFTDGVPDQGNDPVRHAQRLKDAGIEVYTVGVGSGTNPKLMKAIASDDKNPLQPHYLQAESFSHLLELLSNIASAACKGDTCANKN